MMVTVFTEPFSKCLLLGLFWPLFLYWAVQHFRFRAPKLLVVAVCFAHRSHLLLRSVYRLRPSGFAIANRHHLYFRCESNELSSSASATARRVSLIRHLRFMAWVSKLRYANPYRPAREAFCQ